MWVNVNIYATPHICMKSFTLPSRHLAVYTLCSNRSASRAFTCSYHHQGHLVGRYLAKTSFCHNVEQCGCTGALHSGIFFRLYFDTHTHTLYWGNFLIAIELRKKKKNPEMPKASINLSCSINILFPPLKTDALQWTIQRCKDILKDTTYCGPSSLYRKPWHWRQR